jgi:hypothetical protein
MVAVAAWFLVNPPVPVQVKPVAIAILNIVVAAVVLDSAMFPEPNEMARVFELLEEKTPVVKVKLASARVPAVKIVVFPAPDVNASPRVTVIPEPLIVSGPEVFPAVVKVPVALIVSVPV